MLRRRTYECASPVLQGWKIHTYPALSSCHNDRFTTPGVVVGCFFQTWIYAMGAEERQPAALSFDKVVKRYGARTVLDHIDLEVAAGECFALVGVNGAGKTTLIKSLLDFTDLDGGGICIHGEPHGDTASRRHLAFLPERFIPPHYFTAGDFLKYMAQLHGVPYDARKVEALYERLDLDKGSLGQAVRRYSKGMVQKLGLIACFLSGRRLLVLDEPMSGLDPKARALVKSYLRELKARDYTIFMATHLLNDVETLCDRLAILHGGRLRFVGTPARCCLETRTDDLEQAYLAHISSTRE